MMSKRGYQQNCALAIALDLVGDRWTLLLVRELLLGPRRFRDLLANLPGIGTNLLSERLQRLGHDGLIVRLDHDQSFPRYILSERGRGLQPAIFALLQWGMQFGHLRSVTRHRRIEWALLPLRALLLAEQAARWRGSYRLVIDGEAIDIAWVDGQLQSVTAQHPMATISTDSATAGALASGQIDAQAALIQGLLHCDGPDQDIDRFFSAFAAQGEDAPA